MQREAPGRLVLRAIVGVCVTALVAALILQYGFGLEPCILCKIERVPYLVAALLASAALTRRGWPNARMLVGLVAFVFFVGAAIAFYHVGVENHWWASPTCGANSTGPMTMADMKRALSKPVDVPCDRVPWSLFGISLTGYNMLLSLLLGALCTRAFVNKKWWSLS